MGNQGNLLSKTLVIGIIFLFIGMSVVSSTGNIDKASFIYKSNDPPFVPNNPIPSDGATNVSIYVSLRWMGGDPDGDLVTYDVYFGTTNPPPQVASNVSEYEPGILDFNTTYYWKLVAWDEHGAYTEGPIWSFKTGINCTNYEIEIDGPTRGKPGITYCYNITIDDYDDSNLTLLIDWDDGTQQNEWYEPDQNITVCHCWEEKGTYVIRAIAKDQYSELLAEGKLMVTIPRIRISGNSLFRLLLDRFPLLEVFLRAMNLLR